MLELITGVVVAIVALLVVLQPLLTPDIRGAALRSPQPEDDVIDMEESESPKIMALLALREIEFDRATGKLSDVDYAALKSKYAESAVSAIREEKAVDQQTPHIENEDDAAEAMIARARSTRLSVCPTCDHKLEVGSIFCSNCGRSLVVDDSLPRCWVCGADLSLGGKFCGECGTRSSHSAPVTPSRGS